MKWALYVSAAVVALTGIVILIGALLPVQHVAAVEARYAAEPQRVYAVIADVANSPSWRTGVSRVDVLSRPGEPLSWRETGDYGTLTFVQDEAEAPSRVVGRILDVDQGFGGTWTYEITPVAGGSTLTITERGAVYNPFFRFMSRFVFGYYRTMETYARDLGRYLGEEVQPMRRGG